MKIEQQLAADVLPANRLEDPLRSWFSPSCAFRVKNPKIQPLR